MIERVFVSWLGSNPMSDNRQRALESLSNTGVPVQLITLDNVGQWVLPEKPLHPAWSYLSAIDRGDYLGAYLMHHYGGGYSDLKLTERSWLPAFDTLRAGRYVGVGYPELGRWGVTNFDLAGPRSRFHFHRWNWWRRRWLQINYRSLIGNGAYIFLPRTSFTSYWFAAVEGELDKNLELLRCNPARDPRERRGSPYDGCVSQYPLTWAHLHADIFHPLVYRYRRQISQELPPPSFVDYL